MSWSEPPSPEEEQAIKDEKLLNGVIVIIEQLVQACADVYPRWITDEQVIYTKFGHVPDEGKEAVQTLLNFVPQSLPKINEAIDFYDLVSRRHTISEKRGETNIWRLVPKRPTMEQGNAE